MTRELVINGAETVTFGSNRTPFVFGQLDGQGIGRMVEFGRVQRAGASQGRRLTARKIVFDGYVQGHTRKELDTEVFRLNRAIGEGCRLFFGNYAGKWRIDAMGEAHYGQRISDGSPTGLIEVWEHVLPVNVQFTCPDPYWREPEERLDWIKFRTGMFQFPLQLPTRFGSGGCSKEVINDGDCAAPVKLMIYGPAPEPEIHNHTTEKVVRVRHPLHIGDWLQIDTNPAGPSVRLCLSGVEMNGLGWLDLEDPLHGFWQLMPGMNQIEYRSGDNLNNAAVVMEWNPMYAGV